ncbi:hypothetical protein TSO5_05890 [Azospirillum sp. TSO5]|nr:hypothetical protein TSO5_05890 [Azospirillum sp. TSO5]
MTIEARWEAGPPLEVPMQTVTFTRDMRPWREGDSVPLPDDVADALVANGEAKDARPFPETATPVETARRGPGRPARYMTKGA